MASTGKKIDFKRQYRELYTAPRSPVLVEVPPLRYLAVNGGGGPYGETYRAGVEALFALSYAIKFAVRTETGIDYGVMPLESLWHDKVGEADKGNWHWTAMIMQPPLVDETAIEAARGEVARKKMLSALPGVRYETREEGCCAQVLHVGSYDAEDPVIEGLHSFIENSGRKMSGVHHEIYLNNPERTSADRLRTIIRQPTG